MDEMDETKQKKSSQTKRKHFSEEEDESLIRLVGFVKQRLGDDINKCGFWPLIASFVPGRTAKQCRDRYMSYLDPNLSREPFTPDEDQIIIEKQRELGNKWAEIAIFLPNRTARQVKNRFYAYLKNRFIGKNHQAKLVTPQELQQDTAQQPVLLPEGSEVQNDNAKLSKNLSEAIRSVENLPPKVENLPPKIKKIVNQI